ncbi:Uncharacterised protein [Chlamydia trachomatis]|nr:Uncharacterised protein [Chlamydia trachomatis]
MNQFIGRKTELRNLEPSYFSLISVSDTLKATKEI